jgi:hypothetical protein
MRIIIEWFEVARVCKALRKQGWHLVSGYGNRDIVDLEFAKTEISPLATSNMAALE